MIESSLSVDTKTQLGDYVERIESLMAEKKEASEKIKAEYAEAAGQGFDKKAIAQIIKERMADLDKTIEHRKIVDTYRRALGSLAGTPLGDWARQWIANDARHDQRTTEQSPMTDWMKSRSAAKSGGEDRKEAE